MRGADAIGPGCAAAVGAQGREFAGAEAGDNEAAMVGGRGLAKHGGDGFGGLEVPERAAVGGSEGQKLVGDGDQEDAAVGDRRG